MKDKISIIVFIYNSYKDPLFQNLLLSYIKTLSQKGNYHFDLITFEQAQYALSKAEVKNEKESLLQYNIHWHSRHFHTGRFLLMKKAIDVIGTFFLLLKLKMKNKSQFIFAFANVAAAISVLFSQLMNLKLVIYSYEPHSEFMAELGHWSKSSWNYRILNRLEKWAANKASHIITGTKHMVKELKRNGTKAKVYRAPTAVDPEKFDFKPRARDRLRKQFQIEDKQVFIYPGKLGGLYYEKELIELFGQLYKQDQKSFFFIATDYDHKTITNWLIKENIPSNCFHIRPFIPFEEIPDYLSMADMGIVAIPPTQSQKFRSPTKVAEYLLCGLPYLVCKGVSEDDEYAKKHQVGMVVSSFKKADIPEDLLTKDLPSIAHCRSVGLDYRSKVLIDQYLKNIFIQKVS